MTETFFTIVVILIVAYVLVLKNKKDTKEKRSQIDQAMFLTEKALMYADRAQDVNGVKAKQNNCSKALQYIYEAKQYKSIDECKEFTDTFPDLIAHLKALKKVLPVIAYLEKAEKHRYKDSKRAEKNSLLDAMYEIEKYSITDDDFIKSELPIDYFDEDDTVNAIKRRLNSLGYDKRDS